jgi:membrane-associated phospholipid phosphatase
MGTAAALRCPNQLTKRLMQLRSLSAALAFTALANSAVAQTDTLPLRPLFTWNDAALAGAFVLGTLALHPLDKQTARELRRPQNQSNKFFQDVSTFVRTTADPGSVLIGVSLYAVGRVSKQERVADLGLHGLEALVVGAAVANVMKVGFGRGRPYLGNDTIFNPDDWGFGRGWGREQYRSFPSGHTVAAFAAAAAVTNEAARWRRGSEWIVGPVLFGGAALAGASRMYNNKHWLSDVVMGAAIGVFSGNKVVRYHHRVNPDNKLDQWLLSVNVSPTPDGARLAFSVLPQSALMLAR